MTTNRLLVGLMAAALSCTIFATPASAFADSNTDITEKIPSVPEQSTSPGEPLSTGSEFSTRDLLYDKATNKQFITVEGQGGNTFYIVIDYDAPVNEEEEQYATYFLNKVDEADLQALLEEGEPATCGCTKKCTAGAVNTSCTVCASNMTECIGEETEPEIPKEPEPAPEPQPETDPKGDMRGMLVVLLVLALAGGGAVYYFKVRGKPKTKGSTDLDDYDYGDEEEEYELEPNHADSEPDDDREGADT